jgi:ribosomal protein S18 acetylase RimI-like enzyme
MVMIFGDLIAERLSISRARDEDVDQIIEMYSSLVEEEANQYDSDLNTKWPEMFGRKYLLKAMSDEDSVCLLANYDRQIVGYVAGHIFNSGHFISTRYARLQTIYVKRIYRCHEIGTKLVGGFIQWAEKNRVKKIAVSVYMANELAIRFYTKFGFEPQTLDLKMDIDTVQTEPIQKPKNQSTLTHIE